jgi:N-acetylneuraminic acid mutarotase
MVSVGSIVYVLCGWRGKSSSPIYLNDIFSFDTIASLWSPVRTAGISPVARAYAGAACHKSHLFLFGGCNGNLAHNFRNDLMHLDLTTFCWTICVPSTTPPLGRSNHGMCAFGGRLYIFGGVHLVGGKRTMLSDLHEFDPHTRAWSMPSSPDSPTPPPRASHGMAALHGAVFIYGGMDENETAPVLDCLWAYNPVSRLWHSLENRSAPHPPPTPSHPTCCQPTAAPFAGFDRCISRSNCVAAAMVASVSNRVGPHCHRRLRRGVGLPRVARRVASRGRTRRR